MPATITATATHLLLGFLGVLGLASVGLLLGLLLATSGLSLLALIVVGLLGHLGLAQ